MKNVTKGEVSISRSGLYVNSGITTIADFNFGIIREAAANAELFTDALNTHNETGLTPSELKEQNRALVEALEGLPALLNVSADVLQMRAEEMRRDSVYAPQLKAKADIIKELLTKHQKDV